MDEDLPKASRVAAAVPPAATPCFPSSALGARSTSVDEDLPKASRAAAAITPAATPCVLTSVFGARPTSVHHDEPETQLEFGMPEQAGRVSAAVSDNGTPNLPMSLPVVGRSLARLRGTIDLMCRRFIILVALSGILLIFDRFVSPDVESMS